MGLGRSYDIKRKSDRNFRNYLIFSGAEDGAQTRDPQLGRLMLYQLSYFRIFKWAKMDSNHRRRKPADLQSAPFGHSGICPFAFDSLTVSRVEQVCFSIAMQRYGFFLNLQAFEELFFKKMPFYAFFALQERVFIPLIGV